MHFTENTFRHPEKLYVTLPIPEGYTIIKSLTLRYAKDTDFPLQENDLYYDWKTQSFKTVIHKNSVTNQIFTVDRYDFIIRKNAQ